MNAQIPFPLIHGIPKEITNESSSFKKNRRSFRRIGNSASLGQHWVAWK